MQRVKVVASNASLGQNFSMLSNEQGVYVLTGLRPRDYQITVEKDGFGKVQLIGLAVEAACRFGQRFRGRGRGRRGTKPLVRVGHGRRSAIRSEHTAQNGRTFQSLIALTPGFALTSGGQYISGSSAGQFSTNGQRENANYFTVDGASANFSIVQFGQSVGGTIPAFTAEGITGGLVTVDAMQEFRVQTSSFAADTRRTPGGQISIVTRSGSNASHGTLIEYWSNDVVDARKYFDVPPQLVPVHQPVLFSVLGWHPR